MRWEQQSGEGGAEKSLNLSSLFFFFWFSLLFCGFGWMEFAIKEKLSVSVESSME